jgi:hypothetical protein
MKKPLKINIRIILTKDNFWLSKIVLIVKCATFIVS